MKKWNMDVVWPANSEYVLRCIEESFAPSNSGNPMWTLKYEVVSPESVDVAGDQYNIAGTPLKYYAVAQTLEDGVVNEEKSAENLTRLKDLYAKHGIEVEDTINIANPPGGFVGKIVWAELDNDQKVKYKSPTAEHLKQGKKQGDVMINPVTKQPLKTNYPVIRQIFGLVA